MRGLIFVQIYHLSILGGFTNREVLERILSCLFTSTLAPRYNWKGKGQKRGLESLMLAKAVKGIKFSPTVYHPLLRNIYVRNLDNEYVLMTVLNIRTVQFICSHRFI